jgi:uncharacterized OB-fold protein
MSASGATPVVDGLLQIDDDGPRLIGMRCASCGGRSFPYTDTCPWCGAEATDQVALSTTGALWAWTAVTTAPPGYEGPVPFGFGVVQLDGDDVRVITRLTEADPGALAFGRPMRLVLDPVATDEDGNDIVAWAFEPVAGS